MSASGYSARVRAIQDFHMDEKGWPDIAYTFIINHAGLIYEGVPPGYRGTHTAGHNTTGHAICLLGNFNIAQPTDDALESLVWLIGHGADEGWWPRGLTGGHRDTRGADPGDCPGDNLYALIPEINNQVEDAMSSPKAWDAADWAAFDKHVVDNSVGAFIGKDPNRRTIATSIARIESATVGLDTTTDAELAAAVAELKEIIPPAVLEALKEAL